MIRKTITPVAVLAEYPSKSDPEKKYQIRVGNDFVTYCTCVPWWKDRNRVVAMGKEPGEARCDHLRDYLGEK